MKMLLFLVAAAAGLTVLAWLALRPTTPSPTVKPPVVPSSNPRTPTSSDLGPGRGQNSRQSLAEEDSHSAEPGPEGTPPVDGAPMHGTPILVVDGTSAPVQGAVVAVFGPAQELPRDRGQTDPRGLVALSVSPGDRLVAVAEGFAQTTHTLGEAPWDLPLRLTLERGLVVLHARVVDELGAGVHAAVVQLEVAGRVLRGRTDLDGWLTLRDHRKVHGRQDALLDLWHPEFCWPLRGIGIPIDFDRTEPRTLHAFRWARIHLELRGPGGEVLTGARARLALASEPRAGSGPGLGPEPGLGSKPHASAGGSFPAAGSADVLVGEGAGATELRAPPLVPLVLRIDHPAYRARRSSVPPLEPGESVRWSEHFTHRELRPSVRVRLLDADGCPLAGRLTVSTVRETRIHPVAPAGVITLPLPDEDWSLVASSPGRRPVSRSFPVGTPPGESLDLHLVEMDQHTTVTVRRASGEPAGGVVVRAVHQLEDGSHAPTPSAQARTDELGIARLEGLAPGSYSVVVGLGSPGLYQVPGGEVPAPARRTGVHPGQEVAIRLVQPASLGGTARGLEGRPLLWTLVDPDETGGAPLFTVSVFPDAPGGDFRLLGLPPGRYAAWAPGGSHRVPLAEVDLGPGEALCGLSIRAAD